MGKELQPAEEFALLGGILSKKTVEKLLVVCSSVKVYAIDMTLFWRVEAQTKAKRRSMDPFDG